jgi:hypothetical protein
VERDRLRDQQRRLANLANNNLAISQVASFQSLDPSGPPPPASCKQRPSGVAPAAGL